MKSKRCLGLAVILLMAMVIGIVPAATVSMAAPKKVERTLSFDGTSKSEDKIKEEGWAWDADTKVLTLDGFNQVVKDKEKAIAFDIEATIVLQNDNFIDHSIGEGKSKGRPSTIFIGGPKLTITGPGELNIKTNSAEGSSIIISGKVSSLPDLEIRNTDLNIECAGLHYTINLIKDSFFIQSNIYISSGPVEEMIYTDGDMTVEDTNIYIKMNNDVGVSMMAKNFILKETSTEDVLDYSGPFKLYIGRNAGDLIFTRDRDVNKVSYRAGGGTGSMPYSFVVSGKQITLPENEFKGPDSFEFKAWDVEGMEFNPGDSIKPNKNLKIKALWKEKGPSEKPEITRIYGDNRIKTAIKISEESYTSASTVIVARADDYPDSLGASVLAKQLKAPILLTKSGDLDKAVSDEIKRLKATDIIIVGGKAAVSEKVEKALNVFDNDIERIYGDNRYETSALIAKRVVGLAGKLEKAIIASGEDFADALAISPYAANKGQPILLVRKNTVDQKIKEMIKEIGIREVRIAGGTGRISEAVEKELPTIAKRYSGSDRYETAVLIAKDLFPGEKNIVLSRGDEFADALAVGPVAGSFPIPILLTRPKESPKVLLDYIKAANPDHITIVGGTSAVSEDVVKAIKAK